MLCIENLNFSYRKDRPIIKDISINIDGGQICGLLGPNGAGKSTLLCLIAGLLTPESGHVKLKNVDTRLRLPSTLEDIVFVPEELFLPSITLDKYIEFNSKLYPRFSKEDMNRNLELFDIDKKMNLGSMSMGQKKKAFMSFALACNTSLLLMDEPTNGLDIPGKSQFRRFVVSDINEDRTIIISTHQVRDIDKILDHLVIMNSNGIILNNSIEAITEKLYFGFCENGSDTSDAIFTQPVIGGSNIILPNTGKLDSQINLESLFELSQQHGEMLKQMFKSDINKL